MDYAYFVITDCHTFYSNYCLDDDTMVFRV